MHAAISEVARVGVPIGPCQHAQTMVETTDPVTSVHRSIAVGHLTPPRHHVLLPASSVPAQSSDVIILDN